MKTKPVVIGKSQYVETPPNAFRMLAALREMGYKSTDAILDIVDNSLDAGANRVDIVMKDVSGGKGTDFVVDILDNGAGMDAETLKEAFRLGSEREYNASDLGKFGMGLVSAGLSVGRSIRVLSRRQGAIAWDAIMDLDIIQKHGKFLVELHEARSADVMRRGLDKHGTLVSLSKVDRINDRNLPRFFDTLRQIIGRVYREYIKKGVHFYVGSEKQRKLVKAFDPLMLDHELTEIKLDQDVVFAIGKVAHLRVVELPDLGVDDIEAGITARNSGFYLMRNGREIAAAETFGMRGLETRHHSYSHFRAELSFTRELDSFFHVNIKKNFIQLDDRMIDKLKSLCEKLIAESGSRSRDSAVTMAAALPRNAHERSTQLLRGTEAAKPMFEDEDAGESKPLFTKRNEQIVYNRQHPFILFIAEEGRQRPTLVLDVLVHAISQVVDGTKEGAKFLEQLEQTIRQTVAKSK